ncbi:metalloregulator ArsR/SmtB family transcription factor [Pseudarthrobacter oxydans]|uniref:metalloregulator ArsR/SmtB family transcription factor n=1 Tax=Pseudarthrobacter oxydans TaxID=1671 RepID=UPI001FE2F43C|nr:metalloregulator ArsR/SmtB family transcription factor [Pseudarthrobacter oxydans]
MGDPGRVRILATLLKAGEVCVHDLASVRGLSESSVSQALRRMRAHRIVETRRAGRVGFYRLGDSHVRMLLDIAITHASHSPMVTATSAAAEPAPPNQSTRSHREYFTQHTHLPKCASEMHPYERNDVIIDQCTGCRGIFLDRGELESLMDAEASFYAARNPAPGTAQPPYPDRRDGHHDGHGDRARPPQARRLPRGPVRLIPGALYPHPLPDRP